jgi:hypothetical protein
MAAETKMIAELKRINNTRGLSYSTEFTIKN